MSDKMPQRIWAGRVDGFGGWHESPDIVNRTPYIMEGMCASRGPGKSAVDKMPSPSFAANARAAQVWVDESPFYEMVAALRISLYALEHGSLLDVRQIIRDALKQAGVEAE